ncbi:unnamed protein product [Cuscuta epithymum]|uniref:Uncharacterized protein n=1 Tax=Cuscuta epithymum TaxID=186058 RepID=A0AAV0DES3_9ASTE|nr:unnamed protein product [Cuscuta epithymum]
MVKDDLCDPCQDDLCDPCVALIPVLILIALGVVIIVPNVLDTTYPSPPEVYIKDFTLSPRFASAAKSSRTSRSPPLTANCTIAFAFNNNKPDDIIRSKLDVYHSLYDQYDEIEVLVVWAGRDQTLMRAHPGTVWQRNFELKPVLLAANDFVVPPDLKSAAVYNFTIEVKSRVKEDPGTEVENVFYILATCKDVRVGFGSTKGVDRVARMLDGPQTCMVLKSKSSYNIYDWR